MSQSLIRTGLNMVNNEESCVLARNLERAPAKDFGRLGFRAKGLRTHGRTDVLVSQREVRTTE